MEAAGRIIIGLITQIHRRAALAVKKDKAMKKISIVSLAATFAFILAMSGHADATPLYSSPGIANPQLYSFTASTTGIITAYFAGSSAAYDNKLTMLVNGVSTGIIGLDNHTSSLGQALVLGNVNAGDTIVFKIITVGTDGNPRGPWFSDKSMNSDGVNHVYSSAWAGDGTVPAGTFVAFEDLPGGGDFNYNDETFVFTNTSVNTEIQAAAVATPESSSLALLCVGLGIIGAKRGKKLLQVEK